MERPPRWLLFAAVPPAVIAAGWLIADTRAVRSELRSARDLHEADYEQSGACQRCHPSQFESWGNTFHRTMTQEASPTSVLGDFDDATLMYGGVRAEMRRDVSGHFTMRFTGPDGREWSRATVVRTIGSHRYQQYLAADGDMLFRLPVAWHIEEQRWFHMNGAFLTPDPERRGAAIAPEDYYRHVTRWNDNCVFCHNVAPNPGRAVDPSTERTHFETSVAELGIACGACHGPAQEHARLNSDPVRRYTLHLTGDPDPTVVNPRRLPPERSAEICGRCHGQRIAANVQRFMRRGDPFVPGDHLRDFTEPLTHRTSLGGQPGAFAERFWVDGTARLTAYEYQGLLQSGCDELTCTTCHGMHEGDPRAQIRPDAIGDAACTSCHDPELAARTHTGHSTAVECVQCHMPRIVYGVIGVHRSHRIERPSPRTDRPNACALCHADRTDAWITDGFAALYSSPDASASSTAARASTSPSGAADWPRTHRDALAGDPIERAVALAALGRTGGLRWRSRRVALLLDTLTEERYPALRSIARHSLDLLLEAPDGFVPESSNEQRAEWVRRARVSITGRIELDSPDADVARTLRAHAAQQEIFIGE